MPAKSVAESVRFSAHKMVKVNLFESANMFCDVYCLEPGQAQKPHAHAGADKFYYVIEGRGRFIVGDAVEEHGAGTCVWAGAGVSHGVENTSGGRLVLLVAMAPHPSFGKPPPAGG